MKRPLVFTAIIGIVTLSVSAQKVDASKVPASVKSSFMKKYPGVTAKWEKEDGEYEAAFKQNGNTMSALFETNGNMTESETGIKIAELPASVTSYVKSHYAGKKIKEGAKITKADGTLNYEAEVNGKDVIFDANGKFLKEAKD